MAKALPPSASSPSPRLPTPPIAPMRQPPLSTACHRGKPCTTTWWASRPLAAAASPARWCRAWLPLRSNSHQPLCRPRPMPMAVRCSNGSFLRPTNNTSAASACCAQPTTSTMRPLCRACPPISAASMWSSWGSTSTTRLKRSSSRAARCSRCPCWCSPSTALRPPCRAACGHISTPWGLYI